VLPPETALQPAQPHENTWGDLPLPLTLAGDEGYVYVAYCGVPGWGTLTTPLSQAAWYSLAEYRDASRSRMGYRPDEDSATLRHYGDVGMVGETAVRLHPLGNLLPFRVDRKQKDQ
jgi:hypothetical protein